MPISPAGIAFLQLPVFGPRRLWRSWFGAIFCPTAESQSIGDRHQDPFIAPRGLFDAVCFWALTQT
ncbi:MAG: hypothetical protein CMN97_06955 [Synechococcus sp. NAT40]|nr:hypothetical protein [Synechococcus sp. NAT40]